jgi:hypothetical protein
MLAAPLMLSTPLAAQRDNARLEIALNSSPLLEGPTISVSNLLSNPSTRDLLINGAFPTGIRFRLELWRTGGWSNELAGRTDWNVLVRYDPTRQTFAVRRQSERALEDFGEFTTLAGAEAQFDRPFRVPLHPERSGRYYYNLIVEVQALTETDLDAIQHWIKGTKAKGSNNPLSVLGRGVRSLLSRVLGGDKRHYETQSGVFAVP